MDAQNRVNMRAGLLVWEPWAMSTDSAICAGKVLGRARRVALVGGFSAGLQRSHSADVPVVAGSWVAGTCGAYGGGGVTAPHLGHAAGPARRRAIGWSARCPAV